MVWIICAPLSGEKRYLNNACPPTMQYSLPSHLPERKPGYLPVPLPKSNVHRNRKKTPLAWQGVRPSSYNPGISERSTPTITEVEKNDSKKQIQHEVQ